MGQWVPEIRGAWWPPLSSPWGEDWFAHGNFISTGSCLTCVHAQSLQSCPTFCEPMDCSPPGSSVHWILQVRILEWVAMPSSRGSSWPRDWIHVFCLLHWQEGSLPLASPGELYMHVGIFKAIVLVAILEGKDEDNKRKRSHCNIRYWTALKN